MFWRSPKAHSVSLVRREDAAQVPLLTAAVAAWRREEALRRASLIFKHMSSFCCFVSNRLLLCLGHIPTAIFVSLLFTGTVGEQE